MDVTAVSVRDLHNRLGFSEAVHVSPSSLSKPLTERKVEIEDSLILRYLYRNFRPKRHLEFGTWEGTGALYCLEECDATVWTINLLEGEKTAEGRWAYGRWHKIYEKLPLWSRKQRVSNEEHSYQTDSLGFVGRFYLEKGLGNRVCQIYCDSRKWDISNYPEGFFDSVLIDGGHSDDIVTSDTQKGLKLLRSRGLMIWHDFCLNPEVQEKCPSTRGVVSSISKNWNWICDQAKEIFWIDPSWILLAIKK